jgi:hypothetical protein
MTSPPTAAPYVAGFSPGAAPGSPAAPSDPGAGQGSAQQASYSSASYGVPPPPPPSGAPFGSAVPGPGLYNPMVPVEPEHKHPVGAVVLIIIGIVLLLQTLGVFEEEWIGRAWPVVIIGVGAWLLYHRTRETPRGGPQ